MLIINPIKNHHLYAIVQNIFFYKVLISPYSVYAAEGITCTTSVVNYCKSINRYCRPIGISPFYTCECKPGFTGKNCTTLYGI